MASGGDVASWRAEVTRDLGTRGMSKLLMVAYVRIVALVTRLIRSAANNYCGGVNQSARFRVAALMSRISVAPS